MLVVELLVVVLLIVINGLLAMSELAIVSSRRARLQRLVDTHVVGSRRALALASDPGKFLSTVQIGITLVSVLSGAFSGATIGLRVADWLEQLGLSERAAETTGVGLVIAAIAYGSLIVGELVPKQVALRNPERIAVKVAPAMTFISKIASPLVWLFDSSSRLMLALLGQREQSADKVTEEEIRILVAEAERAGVLEPGEKEMIAGVMRLGDRPVRAVMTPRLEVDMLDLSKPAGEIRAAVIDSPHSRLPVFDGDADDVLGVVQAKDLANAYLAGDAPDIRRLVRKTPVIPDALDARDAVRILKDSKVHIGLVVDEFGNFEGIVTTADILESIVGAFKTEAGPGEPAVVRRTDGSLLLAGWMPADEFSELTGIPLPAERDFHTVAGFVLKRFGALPAVGDIFNANGWRFEVLDLDGRRIDKVLASRAPALRRKARA